MIRLRALLTLAILATLGVPSCSQPPAVPAPDPETLLQAIPPARATQYEQIRDMKAWKNPYLIVRSDGVALLDAADNAEIHLKPDELLATLAKLPASNWPYGRVVAAAESSTRSSEQDAVAIRRNKGIVGGMLEGAHIAVKWVPSV